MPKPPPDMLKAGESGAAAYVEVVRAMLGLTDHVICGSKDLVTIVQWLAKEDPELAEELAKEDAERCKEWQKKIDVEKLDSDDRSRPTVLQP